MDAAKGWCELYSFDEANKELEAVTARHQEHPQVLEVRWQVCANLGRWDAALEIADTLAQLEREQPEGWIYKYSSLVELDRREEACAVASDAAKRFPEDAIIHYDLACVLCGRGRIEEARGALARAIKLGGDEMKKRALEDGDLEPLWR